MQSSLHGGAGPLWIGRGRGADTTAGPGIQPACNGEDGLPSLPGRTALATRDWSVLYWLLAGVPRYTYNQFYNLLRFLDLTLNGRNPEKIDAIVQEASAVSQPDSVKARQAMRSPWEERRHETFQVENMILATVRDGDVDALKNCWVIGEGWQLTGR